MSATKERTKTAGETLPAEKKKISPRRLAREILWLTVGTLLTSVGVYFFKFPNNFSTGGVSGLGVVLGAVIPGVTPSNVVSVLNLGFLALGFVFLHRGFGTRTVYCSLLFSGALEVMGRIWPLEAPLTDQPLLELFFAVILPAIGSGILFNIGGSTGGTDIAAMILKKYAAMDTGMALLCCDVLIAGATLVVFDVRTGLFSVLGLVLKSTLVDTVIESLNRRKSFTIITTQPKPIIDFITGSLHRSATVWTAHGAYTGVGETVLLTALSRSQAVMLRNHIKTVDPHAFMLIQNSSEIFGKGFLRA